MKVSGVMGVANMGGWDGYTALAKLAKRRHRAGVEVGWLRNLQATCLHVPAVLPSTHS